MKLLVTNDIHGRVDWYSWLINSQHDNIILAGDLINGMAQHLVPEIVVAHDSLVELSKQKKYVFFCSGNHDMNNPNKLSFFTKANCKTIIKDKILNLSQWLDCFKTTNTFGDGSNVIIEDILFTCFENNEFCRDDVYENNKKTLESAISLRDGKQWIVIHHAPPSVTPLCASFPLGGCDWINKLVKEFNPTYVFSGHVHGSPYVTGGNWIHKLNDTYCFNAGSTSDPKFHKKRDIPNHVTIDTDERIVSWFNGVEYQTVRLT